MYLFTNKIVSYLTQTLNLIIHAKQDKLLCVHGYCILGYFRPSILENGFAPS